jgi:hypothetical protein
MCKVTVEAKAQEASLFAHKKALLNLIETFMIKFLLQYTQSQFSVTINISHKV